ncbi:hypothetical protein BP6252_02069 [Coleophoma cylindrospora]|uniref:BTB domain-containing protein n=1 Tax=Coleophoma cylindrospora TaxID=1849047 RepID=A0A3D8SDT8_9HELO|nr:hypothetical protein BP6252_02069 [Coleophoma cylindrospora]
MHTNYTSDGDLLCHGRHGRDDYSMAMLSAMNDGASSSRSVEVLPLDNEQETPSKAVEAASNALKVDCTSKYTLPLCTPGDGQVKDFHNTLTSTATTICDTESPERERVTESKIESRSIKLQSPSHKVTRDPRLLGYMSPHDRKESIIFQHISRNENVSDSKTPDEDPDTSSLSDAPYDIDIASVDLLQSRGSDTLVSSSAEIPSSEELLHSRDTEIPETQSQASPTGFESVLTQKGQLKGAETLKDSQSQQHGGASFVSNPVDMSHGGDAIITDQTTDGSAPEYNSSVINGLPSEESAVATADDNRLATIKEASAPVLVIERSQTEEFSKEDEVMNDATIEEVHTSCIAMTTPTQRGIKFLNGEDDVDCGPNKQASEIDHGNLLSLVSTSDTRYVPNSEVEGSILLRTPKEPKEVYIHTGQLTQQERTYKQKEPSSLLQSIPTTSILKQLANTNGEQNFHSENPASNDNESGRVPAKKTAETLREPPANRDKKRARIAEPLRPSKRQKTRDQTVISISDDDSDLSSLEDLDHVSEFPTVNIDKLKGTAAEAYSYALNLQSKKALREDRGIKQQEKSRGGSRSKSAVKQSTPLSRNIRNYPAKSGAGTSSGAFKQESPDDSMCKIMKRNTGDFPRYDKGENGDVYIEIAYKDLQYSYNINRAVLEKSSAWFNETINDQVAEYDEGFAKRIVAATGKIARYELKWFPEVETWKLRRASFTTPRVNAPTVPFHPPDAVSHCSGVPLILCRAFDNLFRIVCGLPPMIDTSNLDGALEELEALCRVALKYGHIQQISANVVPILKPLGKSLFEAVLRNPVGWLTLSLALQIKIIFVESMIHLVGLWPYWPSQTMPFNKLPRKVRDLILSKSEKLRLLKAGVDEQLFMASFRFEGNVHDLCLDPEDKDGFDAWFVVQLWRDWLARSLKTYYQSSGQYHGIGSIYRQISRGGDSYLSLSSVLSILDAYKGPDFAEWDPKIVEDALNDMKTDAQKFVRKLVVNNCSLNPEHHSISHLTCTSISNAELPWIVRPPALASDHTAEP